MESHNGQQSIFHGTNNIRLEKEKFHEIIISLQGRGVSHFVEPHFTKIILSLKIRTIGKIFKER